MSRYRIRSQLAVDCDVEAAFNWYEAEEPGLGAEFVHELRAAYDRIAEGPFRYQALRSGVRRALTKRFPYAIYFSVEGDEIIILAVLHAKRDPAEWQRRI